MHYVLYYIILLYYNMVSLSSRTQKNLKIAGGVLLATGVVYVTTFTIFGAKIGSILNNEYQVLNGSSGAGLGAITGVILGGEVFLIPGLVLLPLGCFSTTKSN